MLDWGVVLPALGIFVSVVLTAIISWRVASGSAKKSDMDNLQSSYGKLQATYLVENDRLNNALESERNARRADKLECQSQIDALQRQLTVLLTKMPEPGTVVPVKVVEAELLQVKVSNPLPVPVKIVDPLPLPMTQAQAAAAAAAASEEEK